MPAARSTAQRLRLIAALALILGASLPVAAPRANPDLIAEWLAKCQDTSAPREQRLTDCGRIIDEQTADEDARVEALLERGLLLEEAGDLSAAQADYVKAVELDPESDTAHFSLGNVQEALGLYEDAVRSYDAAIRLNPEHDEAYNNRGRALEELGRTEQAIESFSASIRIDPDDPIPYFNRGTAWIVLNDFAKALPDLEKANALGLKDAELLAARGRAQEGLGNIEAARADYQAALADDPQNETATEGLQRLPK